MPLDLYICDQGPAAHSPTVLSSDEVLHRQIFHGALLSSSDYPVLWRLDNYFADARFDQSELDQLATEARAAAKQVGSAQSKLLVAIAEAAELAKVRASPIVAMCD